MTFYLVTAKYVLFSTIQSLTKCIKSNSWLEQKLETEKLSVFSATFFPGKSFEIKANIPSQFTP